MNKLINKIKSVLDTRPVNAFLLFLTGFCFSQVLLFNVLYSRHPQGGLVTEFGSLSTVVILYGFLFAFALCLFALWRSVSTFNAVAA